MCALKWKARKLIWAEPSVRVWQRSHYPTICLHCSKKSQQTACWWQIQWSWTNKPQKKQLALKDGLLLFLQQKVSLLCARNALERALLWQDSFQLFSSIFGKLPTAFQIPREKSLKKKHCRFSNIFAEIIIRLCTLLDLPFTERLEQFRRSHCCRNPLSPGFSIRASALLQAQPINAPKQERGD